MNLRFLDAFMWIVRLQSFRAAAEHLNVSQAAVSSRIATLEDQLGCQLFDRQSRDLRLTSAGNILVGYAERMLTMRDEIQVVIGTGITVGPVRIGVVETVVHTILLSVLQTLNASHPGIAFEVSAEPTSVLHEYLRRGTIDLAMHFAPLTDGAFTNKSLCELPMGWVRRPSDRNNPPPITELTQLAEQPIITFARGSQPYNAVIDLFRSVGALPRIHCITSISAIMRLVHAGMGVASMPLAAIRDEVAAELVTIVAPKISLQSLPLLVSYRSTPADHAIDLVVDVIRRETARFCEYAGPRYVQRRGR